MAEPRTAPRELPTPDPLSQLPPGRYQLALISARVTDPAALHVPLEALVSHRTIEIDSRQDAPSPSLTPEERAGRLLVRPTPGGPQTALGFRGVTGEQLQSLKAAGFEPSWTLAVGERFDVLLRSPQRLAPAAAEALRERLIERFALPRSRGLFLEAVHLPGHPAGPGAPVAQLLATRATPLSAELVEARPGHREARPAPEIREVRAIAPELARAPLAVLEERLAPRPNWPADSPWTTLQAGIERARSAPGDPQERFARAVDLELTARAQAATLDLAETRADRGADLAATRAEVLALEAELGSRKHALASELADAEQGLAEAARKLEQAARAAGEDPGNPETLRSYQDQAAVYFERETSHRELELGYRWLTLAELERDRERLAFALPDPSSPEAAASFAQLNHRENLYRLAQGDGPSQWVHPALRTTSSSPPEPFAPEKTRPRLPELPARELETLRASLTVRLERRQPLPVWSAYRDLRELLAHSATEPHWLTTGSARERLEALAARVARGETGPKTLREVQNALVATFGAGELARPPATPARPDLARLVTLDALLRDRAHHLSIRGAQTSLERRREFLTLASEAVALHRRAEQGLVHLARLPDPATLPGGAARPFVNRDWLELALEKGGLRPALGKEILANLLSAPTLEASRFLERGLRAVELSRELARDLGRDLAPVARPELAPARPRSLAR